MKKYGYSFKEACTESGVGRTKMYEYIASGELIARKLGKRTIILAPDLERFLENLPVMKPRANARKR